MAVDNEIALSRLLGRIYTEVFQRKPQNPNKPLNRGTHNPYEQIVTDALKSRLITGTNVFQWGPGGVGDETNGSPSSARWSFTGWWS